MTDELLTAYQDLVAAQTALLEVYRSDYIDSVDGVRAKRAVAVAHKRVLELDILSHSSASASANEPAADSVNLPVFGHGGVESAAEDLWFVVLNNLGQCVATTLTYGGAAALVAEYADRFPHEGPFTFEPMTTPGPKKVTFPGSADDTYDGPDVA